METLELNKLSSSRQREIAADFLRELDKHLDDLLAGKAERMHEIRDVADLLNIHPTHLSNTVKQVTGKSTCFFYEDKILSVAKDLLINTSLPIAEIAAKLTYDPSNFTKFFKAFEGTTPKKFREQMKVKQAQSETLTI